MAYPTDTGTILQAAGYEPLVDFICERAAGSDLTLEWLHADAKPTEAQVTAWGDDSQALPSGKTYTQSQDPEHYLTSTGIKMATDLQSQAAFSNMMTLLNEAGMADTEMVMIKDCLGASHGMTLADFKTHAVAYGLHCYTQFHSS